MEINILNSHAHGSRMPLVKPDKTKPLTTLPMKYSLNLKGYGKFTFS